MSREPEPMTLIKEADQAYLRLVAYEEAIQTGEIDERDEEGIKRRLSAMRAKKLMKYRADVQQIIARPEGRRVLWRILEIAGPNRISHVPGDPYSTAFSEGKRAVANEVLLMLFDSDPDVYAKMQREAHSDMKSELERIKKEMEER